MTNLQEQLIAATNDNNALRVMLDAANKSAAAAQRDNERLRAETTRLRWVVVYCLRHKRASVKRCQFSGLFNLDLCRRWWRARLWH